MHIRYDTTTEPIGRTIDVTRLTHPQTVTHTARMNGRDYLLTTPDKNDEHAPTWWVERRDDAYHILGFAGMSGWRQAKEILENYETKGVIPPYRTIDRTATMGVECEHEYGYDEDGIWTNVYTYTKDARKAVVVVFSERPASPSWHERQSCTLSLFEDGEPYGTGRTRAYNYADNARSNAIRFVAGDGFGKVGVSRVLAAKPGDDVREENLRIIKELTGYPSITESMKEYSPFDLLAHPDHEAVRRYVSEYARLHAAVDAACRAEREALKPYNEWEREWRRRHPRRRVYIKDMREYPDFENLMACVDAVSDANRALADGLRRVAGELAG